MADEKREDDTSEYSSSQAPETAEQVEETASHPDGRLQPGGGRGTPDSTGMSGLEREQVPNEARADEKKRSD